MTEKKNGLIAVERGKAQKIKKEPINEYPNSHRSSRDRM